MKIKIAIVNSSSFGKIFPEHIEKLQTYGDVASFNLPKDIGGKELAAHLQGYQIIIASVTAQYNKEFFENKDKTLLISRHGIGYNNIDIKAAHEHGVIVTKVSSIIEREAVAENAVALLMTVMRQVRGAAHKAKIGKWEERARFIGNEIKDKIVGVIGFGNIGSRVGEILKYGFGAKLIAYDPGLSVEQIMSYGARAVTLPELLSKADIISLNAAVNESSYHMLSQNQFSLLKKQVYIVNTARGELMDETALRAALDNGTIAGLGVDVIEGEPINAEHPLLKYENVVITPHTSAYTYECLLGMGNKVLNDIENVLAGKQPDNIIEK